MRFEVEIDDDGILVLSSELPPLDVLRDAVEARAGASPRLVAIANASFALVRLWDDEPFVRTPGLADEVERLRSALASVRAWA